MKQLTQKLGDVIKEKECLEDLLKRVLLKSELSRLKIEQNRTAGGENSSSSGSGAVAQNFFGYANCAARQDEGGAGHVQQQQQQFQLQQLQNYSAFSSLNGGHNVTANNTFANCLQDLSNIQFQIEESPDVKLRPFKEVHQQIMDMRLSNEKENFANTTTQKMIDISGIKEVEEPEESERVEMQQSHKELLKTLRSLSSDQHFEFDKVSNRTFRDSSHEVNRDCEESVLKNIDINIQSVFNAQSDSCERLKQIEKIQNSAVRNDKENYYQKDSIQKNLNLQFQEY